MEYDKLRKRHEQELTDLVQRALNSTPSVNKAAAMIGCNPGTMSRLVRRLDVTVPAREEEETAET